VRIRIALGLVVLLALASCGSESKVTGAGGTAAGTIKLGAALSLTGKLAREGILTREGYDYCRDKVNAQGGVKVAGKFYKLAITYQDDKSTPDTAAQLVDQMNDGGIKFILGPYGSASTEAAAAVVEKNGQLMIDSAGADNAIFAKGYKQTFAVLSPATTYVTAMVKAAAELASPKPKTVAILSADDGFSKTAAEAGAKAARSAGMNVVATEFFPNGTTDVSSELTKVKPKHVDLILGSVHLAEGIAIIKQSQELGVNPKGGFGLTVAVPTPTFVKTLGKAANDVIGSSQWTPQTKGRDSLFGSAEDYTTGIRTKLGHAPEYHNAEASAACLAFIEAANKAGSLDVGKVRDALASLDVDTFFGHIKFDSTGKNADKPMSVVQVQNGQLVTVWPKGPGTKPLVWPTPAFGRR